MAEIVFVEKKTQQTALWVEHKNKSPAVCYLDLQHFKKKKKKKKKGRALWRPADSQVHVHHPANNSVQSTLFILKTCAGANFVPALQEIQ